MTRSSEQASLIRHIAYLTALSLLFLYPVSAYADISYCGPVSYKYSRNFQWRMDYTDKQGNNHKQNKKEMKIFDGEWYICLSGKMLGYTGAFDGEQMQQYFTYSETDNWLDRRTSQDNTSGKKHDNGSLAEGQQGYMRGSLLLECPEGNELPGRNCRYTLNLALGTGYVYQTRQETWASGDQPPGNFTMTLPQVFGRQVLLTDKPVADGWSLEDSLTRDIKVEEHTDECVMVLRQPHIDSCSYEEKETASWDLKRMRGPCDAFVSNFKGDVTINGKSVSGQVNLAKGDVIRTGAHSKVNVAVGRNQEYKFGSDSAFTMVDPCEEKQRPMDAKISTMTLIRGKVTATIRETLGVEPSIRIVGTAVTGSRGETTGSQKNIIALLSDIWLASRIAEAAVLPENIPTLGTRVADTAFTLEVIPKEKVIVEVFKGSVLVLDNRGSRQMLVGTDQTVSSWEDGSAFEDVTITNAPD